MDEVRMTFGQIEVFLDLCKILMGPPYFHKEFIALRKKYRMEADRLLLGRESKTQHAFLQELLHLNPQVSRNDITWNLTGFFKQIDEDTTEYYRSFGTPDRGDREGMPKATQTRCINKQKKAIRTICNEIVNGKLTSEDIARLKSLTTP